MQANTPAYYRARLGIFRHFIQKELPGNPLYDTGKKNSPYELLKQGFIHPDIQEKFENRIADYAKQGISIPNDPLGFTEICSFNTWFAIHPEKVAGVEMVTTSRDFPLTIKGTKEDINLVFAGLSKPLIIDKQKRLRMAMAQAEAKLKLLSLMQLEGTDDNIKIGVRDAKRFVTEGTWFFVVREWMKEGRLVNKVTISKYDPYTKFIEVGKGSLVVDYDQYTLSWQE